MPLEPVSITEQLGVLKKLKESVELNTHELNIDIKTRTINTVAWLARNLVELALWCEYCGQSKENARELLLDSARDAYDSINIPDGVVSQASFQEVQQELLNKAETDGFDIKKKYTDVGTVAKNLGMSIRFKYLNKMLSKFAHPTALAILSTDSNVHNLLRQKFYEIGISASRSATHSINGHAIRITSGNSLE